METFLKCYEDYVMVAKLLDRGFDYLNRYHLKAKGQELLGVTSIQIFIDNLYKPSRDSLRVKILETFSQDRNGSVADKQLLEKLIKCYVKMG